MSQMPQQPQPFNRQPLPAPPTTFAPPPALAGRAPLTMPGAGMSAGPANGTPGFAPPGSASIHPPVPAGQFAPPPAIGAPGVRPPAPSPHSFMPPAALGHPSSATTAAAPRTFAPLPPTSFVPSAAHAQPQSTMPGARPLAPPPQTVAPAMPAQHTPLPLASQPPSLMQPSVGMASRVQLTAPVTQPQPQSAPLTARSPAHPPVTNGLSTISPVHYQPSALPTPSQPQLQPPQPHAQPQFQSQPPRGLGQQSLPQAPLAQHSSQPSLQPQPVHQPQPYPQQQQQQQHQQPMPQPQHHHHQQQQQHYQQPSPYQSQQQQPTFGQTLPQHPHSQYQQAQPPTTTSNGHHYDQPQNGYLQHPTDPYNDYSAQSSTATTPYTSGHNSPVYQSSYSSHYPPTMVPSQPPKKVDRIDPKQIPRPQELKGSVVKYYTRSGLAPPSSTSDFIAIDEGNASPRFIRMTTNQIAHESELIDNTKLCVGAIIQPLAPLGEGEDAIPVIDYSDGPVRCSRCMAYVNPFFTFIDNGQSFICSICGLKNQTPEAYHCNLDANGLRRDRNDRPELCRGSVEYVVGKDFLHREISDPCYLFVIDVSYAAIMSGLTMSTLESIKASLSSMALNDRIRVGLITYDANITFWSLNPTVRQEPEMLVMADIDDVFLPCPPDQILIKLSSAEHRALFEGLLERISAMYVNKVHDQQSLMDGDETQSASFGAALMAASECLIGSGGKILMTLSSLPTTGVGALTMRDNVSLYHTDKERTLQLPQSSFFQTQATKCAEHAIAIDLFVGSNSYVDLASIGVLSEKTGGQLFYYPSFNHRKDGSALQHDFFHDVTRYTGFDGVMIVRVSTGLKVAEYFGNFFHKTSNEMDLPAIDSDKAFAIRLEHEGKLKDKSESCIQCALLYTTPFGQRRIRVHTLSLAVTSQMSAIYRFSDLDAIINLSLKQAVRQLLDSTTTIQAQNALTSACIDTLFIYRKYCASATSAGQLILPEPLKLLPLCTLGMIKHPLLQDGIAADDRSYLYLFINSMPCYVSVAFVVPRLYALHSLAEHVLIADTNGRVSIPQSLSLSSDSVDNDGIFLLDDARFLYLFVGGAVHESLLAQLFDNYQSSVPSTWVLKVDTANGDSSDPLALATRVGLLIDTLRTQKSNYQPLNIIARRAPSHAHSHTHAVMGDQSMIDESTFFAHLIEDTGRGRAAKHAPTANAGKGAKQPAVEANSMSYVDFLCWIHKKIQAKFY